jgi:PEP-CTERM motif
MLHIIMALVTIASLVGIAPRNALAVPISNTITITVQGGGTVVVSFSGDDSLTPSTSPNNNNGIIEVLDIDTNGPNDVIELTALTATWTPSPSQSSDPSIPSPFTLAVRDSILSCASIPNCIPTFNDPNQVGFQYDIGNNVITELFIRNGNFISVPPDSIFATECVNQDIEINTQGTTDGRRLCTTIASQGGPPTVIPEPSTWLLLSSGLVGMVGYAVSRCRRSAALRPVSVADTAH